MSIKRVSIPAVIGTVAMALIILPLIATGCARREKAADRPVVVVPAEPQRVVTHPGGRYELRGAGTAASPYYWVWVPSGATAVTLPSLPPTPTVVVTAPAQRVATYPEGRYELAGAGTVQSPYYWVWVPAGATPPPPPPLPRRPQSP
jgi:hypothetical protein